MTPVEAALAGAHPHRRLFGVREWATDGWFAVRGPYVPGQVPQDDRADEKAAGLERVLLPAAVPLVERPGWRRPHVPPGPAERQCGVCRGLGSHSCPDCDDEHGCRACDGLGKVPDWTPEDLGQIVLDAESGAVVVIAGRFAALLDHAARVTLRTQPNERFGAVVLEDVAGEVFAVVMPMDDEPKAPEAQR